MKREKQYYITEYVEKQRSVPDIALELGIQPSSVRYHLRKWGIPMDKNRVISKTMVNKTFNYLTVESLDYIDKKHERTFWKCRCVCGNTKSTYTAALRNGTVPSCGCLFGLSGDKNKNFKGAGNLSGSYFNVIRLSAQSRGLLFDVDVKFLWQLFNKQNARCAISNVDISLVTDYSKETRTRQTASLDRIDSSKGYIEDNVQWVHKRVNIMKGNLQDFEFIDWCKTIVKFQEDKS